MQSIINVALIVLFISAPSAATIVDTGQTGCYNNASQISCPSPGSSFHGQDAQYNGPAPSYTDNGDGTVTDNVTGLMWQKSDDGATRNWADALAYCENLGHAGYFNWRLPNAKELQSLVDYTRSPATTSSAAIDPVFHASSFIDGKGDLNFGYYWTNTTHINGTQPGEYAVYIAFGEALGYMSHQTGRSMALKGTISGYTTTQGA